MHKLLFAAALAASLFPSVSVMAAGPCHTRCKELLKACKSDCKATHGVFSEDRYKCRNRCKSQEHECFAGCA